MKYKAQEAEQLGLRMKAIREQKAMTDKLEAKLLAKRNKLLNEKSFDKWDNPELFKAFDDALVRRVLNEDKTSAQALICPKDQRRIEERKVMAAYLAECAAKEHAAFRSSVSFTDLDQAWSNFAELLSLRAKSFADSFDPKPRQ